MKEIDKQLILNKHLNGVEIGNSNDSILEAMEEYAEHYYQSKLKNNGVLVDVSGSIYIVTECGYYDEDASYEFLKAFKTIEDAENYIDELKNDYKGLESKLWEWEEVPI